MIHCKCGTETSEYHKGSGEGGGLTISHSVRPGGYNGDYPATGQKQTGRVAFSNSDIELYATECLGYKRQYDKSLEKKAFGACKTL